MHKIYITRDKKGLGSSESWKTIKKAARAALEAENITEPCVINVLLTDNEAIREINLEQRGIDSETDVLSFPMNEFEPGNPDFDGAMYDPETDEVLLGDMVLSLEKMRAQADEYGHSEERETAYLTVHSVLHLLGYDHVDEGEMKKQMREREEAILSAINITR